MSARPTRVVLVGGGYVTLHAYAALARRLRPALRRGDLEIVVVSADDHHCFHGFTGEVLARTLPLAVTRTPLATALPRARVVHARVTRVDTLARRVHYVEQPGEPAGVPRSPDSTHDGRGTLGGATGGPGWLAYDELVVAAGATEPVAQVPGLAEHGWTLRSPGDIERLLRRLAQLEHPSAGRSGIGSRGQSGGHGAAVVVVGGGLAGTELAAAVAARAGGRHPVVLVHRGETLAPEWAHAHPRLAARVRAELERLGVHVRLGVAVEEVAADRVTLADGVVLPAALVLATTGQRAVRLPGLEHLPTDPLGRLVTDADLRVAPHVWAAGDAALVRHPGTGRPVPANALWAIKAGGHLGRNLARALRGHATRPFDYRGLGSAAAYGVGRGVAELYGIPLTGWVGWLVRLAFFLRFMPSRGNAAETVAALVRPGRAGAHPRSGWDTGRRLAIATVRVDTQRPAATDGHQAAA